MKDNPSTLQAFVTQKLAEPFEDRGEAPDHLHLYAKREFYTIGKIPSHKVLFLTAFCDIQQDRFELHVMGWTRDKSFYSIEYVVIMADHLNIHDYSKLDPYLDKLYEHPSGMKIKIKGFGLDIGNGVSTQVARMWVRRQDSSRVFATMGRPIDQPVSLPKALDIDFGGQRISNGLRVWYTGVSLLKLELYAKLRKPKSEDGIYPPGYCHFPDYPEEFFRQLTAQSLIYKDARGVPKPYWVKHYERDEGLDTTVGGRAVAIILGIETLTDEEWAATEAHFKNRVEKQAAKKNTPKKSWTLSKGIEL